MTGPGIMPRLRKRGGYLLRDEFVSALAAGSVNGTVAEPGPGTRTVVDTDSKLSINSGALNIAPHSTPAEGDPGLWYGDLSSYDATGRILLAQFNFSSFAAIGNVFGFDTGQSGSVTELAYRFPGASGALHPIVNNSQGPLITTLSTSTDYILALVAGSSGSYFMIKGGTFTNWTLLWIDGDGTVTRPYPALVTRNQTYTSSYIRMPTNLWSLTPLAYDTFTRANGALGSSETTGPDSQSVMARVWTGATWAIDTNQAKNTPSLGADLVTNGDFTNWTGDDPDSWTVLGEVANDPEVSEVGTGEGHGGVGTGMCNIYTSSDTVYIRQASVTADNWYRVEMDVDTVTSGALLPTLGNAVIGQLRSLTFAGSKIITGICAGANFFYVYRNGTPTDVTFDDIIVKQLTLSTLFSSVSAVSADVVATVDLATYDSHTNAGIVLNLDSAGSPANFVLVWIGYQSTLCRVRLSKCVAGTYTHVQDTTVTFSAGASLRVIKDGTSYSVYYDDALVGTAQTISDAGIVDNTLHGLFSTYADNRLDNFEVFPRGTGGEYISLGGF